MTTALLFFIGVLFLASAVRGAEPIECSGHCLKGKVRFITQGTPDYRIRYVSRFEDIRVKYVKFSPQRAGQWQRVRTGQDFTVMVVTQFEDLRVKQVGIGEGCAR